MIKKKALLQKKGKQTARHAAVPAPTQQYQNDNEIFVLLHNRHRSNTKLEKKSMVSGGGLTPNPPPWVRHWYFFLTIQSSGNGMTSGCSKRFLRDPMFLDSSWPASCILSVTKVLLEVKSHLLAERRTVALRVVLSAGEGWRFVADGGFFIWL